MSSKPTFEKVKPVVLDALDMEIDEIRDNKQTSLERGDRRPEPIIKR